MKRSFDALEGQEFDLLVVGGGVVGACTAWDAALRGLAVALVELDDFGGGVSANCLKVVHGGLRHLQKLDPALVRESVRERSFWLRAAPHLVEPLPFLVPTYRRGQGPRALLRTALAVNDLLSWDRNEGLEEGREVPAGRAVTARECLDLVPEVASPGLTGGVVFHDALMYSSERLVLEVVKAAVAAGAVVINHAELEVPLHRAGRVVGGRIRDRVSGHRLDVRARMTVNASGASLQSLAGMMDPTTGGAAVPEGRSLAVNVVTREPAPRVAWTVPGPAADDGRQLLFVPWRGQLMVGTGHYAQSAGANPPAVEAFARRFLAAVNAARPAAPVPEDGVCLVHAGLIPAPPGKPEPVRFLRRHRIVRHGSGGALSVIAPKFTTARAAAADAVDAAFRELGWSPPPSRTATTRLEGAPDRPVAEVLDGARRRWNGVVEGDVLEHLVRSYGSGYEDVLALRSSLPEWDRRVVPEAPVIQAQLVHAVREEMAVCPEDLVWRRTELGPRGLASEEALGAAARAFAPFGGRYASAGG